MVGKKKTEKGLFGLKKKKNMLFTFRPRNGEECSSDHKKVKRSLSSSDSKRVSKRLCKDHTATNKARNDWTGSPVRLPPEILVRVFIYGVQSEGITKFLPRVSRVCKEWHAVASDPNILTYLDLSNTGPTKCGYLTKQRLGQLFSTRDLAQCRTLNLTAQDRLNVSTIITMLTKTPRLASLDLRGCQVTTDMLKKLPTLGLNLQRLDLSGAFSSYSDFTLGPLQNIVLAYGPRLVELRLGELSVLKVIKNSQHLLKTITGACPLLEELDLRLYPEPYVFLTPSYSLDIAELAKGCPRLIELHLDGHCIVDNTGEMLPYNPCFSKLKIFSQSRQLQSDGEVPVFYRMFSGNSLIELNVSRTLLYPSRLADHQVHSVKNLYLSNMLWCEAEKNEFSKCMECWHDSIEMLDMSGNKEDWFSAGLNFFTEPKSCARASLKVLDLSNSTVDSETVMAIIRNCKQLQSVDLSSCRELPRGCKRKFHHEEFANLMKSLQE